MDAPDHPKYRELVQPWFKPANLKRLEDRLEVITRNILDDMMGDGGERTLDFVQDVAVFHPLKMIVELLGVPEQDEWRILKLTNELFAGDDPEMRRVGADPLSIFETVKDLYEYFDRMTEERRARPTEDLASYIANGKIDGDYLPFKELISYYIIVATAGHETTRTAMSGGLLALLQNPDQLELLRSKPDALMKLAVEEMIRWSTPVTQFCRTATRDTELRGKIDPRRRQPRALLCVGQSRRRDLRRADEVQSGPPAESSPRVRHGSAHVSRQHPRADGNADLLRAVPAADRIDRTGRRTGFPARELRAWRETPADSLQAAAGGLTDASGTRRTARRHRAIPRAALVALQDFKITGIQQIPGGASRETYRIAASFRENGARNATRLHLSARSAVESHRHEPGAGISHVRGGVSDRRCRCRSR